MPGVTVLPPSLAISGFGHYLTSKMQNGSSSSVTPYETVSDIKTAAEESARKAGRGASATTLLNSSKNLIARANAIENDGEVKEALICLMKAATLISMCMNTVEYKQEMKKHGALYQQMHHFQVHEGANLLEKIQQAEGKLSRALAEAPQSDDAAQSLVERMRRLQSAGMDVSPAKPASKRISKDLSISLQSPPATASEFSTPLLPSLPSVPATAPNRTPLSGLPSPLPSTSSSLASPATTNSKLPSPHTLIPASSFGPPSPPDSPLELDLTGSKYPSIDELNRRDGLNPPSPLVSSSIHPPASPLPAPTPSFPIPSPAFPIPRAAFPALPLDHAPRPSSTPIPPTVDTFISRPGSPAIPGPTSPSVPRKPSNLGLNKAGRSPLIPSGTLTPNSDKSLSFTSLFPKTLNECMQKHGFQVLLLDVRSRDAFERERIRGDEVVCIEPSILLREGITAEGIENALVIGPRNESTLFSNRDKFDLVAIYDEDSTSTGASPAITNLLRAIYENSFKKFLKNMPMLLIGGLKAWKEEFGPHGLHIGSSGASLGTPSTPVPRSSPSPSTNPFLKLSSASPSLPPSISPSMPLSSPHVNGLGISGTNGYSGNLVSASAALPNGFSTTSSNRGPVSIGLHSRAPAESNGISSTSSAFSTSFPEPITVGRSRSGTESAAINEYARWIPSGSIESPSSSPPLFRSASEAKGSTPPIPPPVDHSKRPLSRKPALSRPSSNSVTSSYAPSIPEHVTTSHHSSASLPYNTSSSIQYPQFQRTTISPQVTGSSFNASSTGINGISPPPQASINPSPLARRRSDYVDQSQEALSGIPHRPIDYPTLSQPVIRPPPIAASSAMERQDNRPRVLQQQTGPKPPMTSILEYPITYWGDTQFGTSGLKNMGNTCYMNSTIQCLSATAPFATYFKDGTWQRDVNMINPMGTKGRLAQAFANILREMSTSEMQTLTPIPFRRSICQYASQFQGSDQHDSQEFLQFLLDGLHEDLNRILQKPPMNMTPEREAELERLPTQIASEQEWQSYLTRNRSLVVDLFQGQFRNQMECLTCRQTSTTYNSFMYLTLPIPSVRSSQVTLNDCLDAFVKAEVMEKSDAWHCPKCKTLRPATKRLTLSRLPPILLVHLKRFSHKGHFTDKIETFVNFPMRGLDLTNYMPSPLPPGEGLSQHLSADDPRLQKPPYRYDLYAVTNHYGTLSSGHYTAFVSSRGRWLYCDDSRITEANPKDVVGKPAYVLYYRRSKT